MPGLKQAARLAHERLVHHLAPYVYAPVQHTPSLWKHESKGILFALVVDDFGIKSTSDSATRHLLQALRDKYQITVDPSSTKFLGFILDWDYSARKVYLSMPNYVQHALHRLQHSLPTRLQHARTATTNPCMARESNLLNHRTTQEKFSSQPQTKP